MLKTTYSRSAMNRRYGNHMSTHNIRRVWALISIQPQLPLRALAAQLGLPYSSIGAALRLLKDAGYIDFPKKSERARTVLVPFVVQELE